MASEPRAPFGDQGVLGFEGDSPLKSGLYGTVSGDPHVAGGDAGDRAVGIVEGLDRRKAGENFDPERLRPLPEPAA